MDRSVILIGVVLVLSGCNGPLGPGPEPPTATAASTPNDAGSDTAGPAAGRSDAVLPGVSDDGVTDASKLAARHKETLANTSSIVRVVHEEEHANGTVRRRRE